MTGIGITYSLQKRRMNAGIIITGKSPVYNVIHGFKKKKAM
jgi:hypothetical protein